MKIKCMIDNVNYDSKPQGREIGKIQNRLSKASKEITIKDLANKLISGSTFRPAFLMGKKDEDWISQQLFALDFDDGTTIKKELERCEGFDIKPCFGYTSFSHRENHHKFRLVFCSNKVIKDINKAKKFQLTLMKIFDSCDIACKNPSRLYFGGKDLIYKGFDNMIDVDILLEKYKEVLGREIDIEKKPHNNKDILYNTSNIVGLKTQTNRKYYNIKALRDRNSEYLKSKIGNPRIVLENNQAFFDYIKSYDLGGLLELNYPKSFKCILHEDNNPSAGIFVNEEGTHIYHCFSCGVSYNIINLIETLCNFKSRPKAYKFIREIFNLEIMDNEWQRYQKEILDENLRTLRNGELRDNCPKAYKNIKRNIRYLEELIRIAKDNVYSEKLTDNDDNVIFFASTRYICKQLGMSPNSSKEVSKKNILFAYHYLINKLSNDEIPKDVLKKSQALSIDSGNKKYKRVNYYSIPSFSTVLFKDIENQGQNWKDNNYKMKGLSREMFYRTEGSCVADWLYPQHTHVYDKDKDEVVKRTTTKKSDLLVSLIVKVIINQIDCKNYITEKEIVEELITKQDIRISKKELESQIKKSLQEILEGYDLKRIRCTKEIKEKYNVDSKGYPYIIVKK